MYIDELEEALTSKTPVRTSPFRQRIEELLPGDYFKFIQDGMPRELYRVLKIDSIKKKTYVQDEEGHRGPVWIDYDRPIVRYLMIDSINNKKFKLECGCHCSGGCGDPYAACMYPCDEHIPF